MRSQETALGVIMLDTEFPRPIGDVGHVNSWNIPVRFYKVPKASPDLVIRHGSKGLLDGFVKAGNALIDNGCTALITSCGFLARHQKLLGAEFSVPFASSSLVQVSAVQSMLGDTGRVGVITYDAQSLTEENFIACNADPKTPVIGVPNNGVFRALIEGGAAYDFHALETEIISAARTLVSKHPQIRAIVLECTNMPPFAKSISQAVGLPVFDILSVGHWLYQSTQPRDFAQLQQRAK